MPTVDTDAVVALTRDLVAIPSVNRPEEGLSEQPAAERVAAEMRALGWEPEVWEAAPGRPNVLATLEGDRPGPTLLFEGHTDVVSEGDPDVWSFDPFAGDVVDGMLRGRGAADMKGGVAAMIHAAAAVTAGGGFPGRVKVAALCDEEGLMLGVKDFVARGHAAGVDGAIVCEPEGDEVCTTQKGAIRVRFRARGKMAHGAMPHQGRNPVAALADLATRLAALERGLEADPGPHADLGPAYLTPTVMSAGDLTQLNVIPETAELAVDVRTIPGTPNDRVVELLHAEAAGVGDDTGVEIALEVIEDRPATETPADHPVVTAVSAAHHAVTGRAAPFGGVPGATDGTILWRDAGLPVVVYGPGDKWIAHQVDEQVAVADLERCARVYADAARRFLEGGPADAGS
ncbi:M20 family peptidase [Egibacter rhizosphaerae]|uniref:Probable succinyl-diaminopimelate desuccinylase n=1 Tax=Egibacter rhizosphaerae TaxID=1670831 RepID=A0A411YJ45_9ACTN|nr:M20 family metallopeptidase [Egibacter rhizosphaerae]QBI21325.1 M20 family peptidase [Egibacter rhizosphaerae]